MSFYFSRSTLSPAEEIHEDSCGRKGLGESSKCEAQEGSPAPRGKRSVFLERRPRKQISS
ncbi:hypothetical protein CUC15_12755 [Oceanobacillus zhaokaii]|uniref:Uncharacterized protein n=1 Tax=Oceanobacillus zhaokaii TaxID=2052660 RepID=A0A345PIB2_9BACI|nr:hypothetical protein CUC15_12755 [Oceanobacillus zhaokaii]